MSRIPNRKEAIPGARYRVCPWYDIYKPPGSTLVGYGLDEKQQGSRRYQPIAWHGTATPWETLAEARTKVAEINDSAQRAQAKKVINQS